MTKNQERLQRRLANLQRQQGEYYTASAAREIEQIKQLLAK